MTPEPPEPPPPQVAKLFRELAVAKKLAHRKKAPPNVFEGSFPEQIAFARDPARLKAAFCTRRASKSFSFGLECLEDSRDWQTGNYLFLGLTREEAKRIFWKDVLKATNTKFDLGIRFNESSLTATMPNGATIYVGAADANEDEMRKLLGQKYRKVGIDEAQDWKRDLEDLVFHILKPACTDLNGSISLMGTPGLINHGLFHEITPSSVQAGIRGERSPGCKGWSIHCWDTHSNTAVMPNGTRVCDRWAEDIVELRAMKPGIDETPWFRRNFLGEKVVDDTFLVYRYVSGRNDFSELPVFTRGEWRFVLGCDLGHEDATAWVVCAWHEHSKILYILSALKEPGLDITAVAERTKKLHETYNFDVLVVDGANKQAVEEMRNRHQIPWEAADKSGKDSFIDLMNSDFITGNIKLGSDAKPLTEEYRSLIWDKKKLDEQNKRVEHAACDNHAADAALYAWRYCYSYLSEKPQDEEEEKPDELEEMVQAQHQEQKRRDLGEVVGEASQWEDGWQWR